MSSFNMLSQLANILKGLIKYASCPSPAPPCAPREACQAVPGPDIVPAVLPGSQQEETDPGGPEGEQGGWSEAAAAYGAIRR